MNRKFPLLFCLVLGAALAAFAEDKPAPAAANQPAPPKSSPTAAPAAPSNEVVARVNGQEIKRPELNAAMQGLMMEMADRGQALSQEQIKRFEQDVLEELIGRELILEEGRTQKIPDLDARVAAELAKMKTRLGSDENVTKTLAENGLTREQYTARVRDNLIVQATLEHLVASEAAVTPEEVRAYYEKNLEKFKQPETVRASHILIRVAADASEDDKKAKRAQIDAIRARLVNGEKFADVAKQVSEDPGSAANGGDLGDFPAGMMVPEFDVSAFSLKPGELSQVITTQFGYHILLVNDHKSAHQLTFPEVESKLEQSLKNQKGMEAARKHVAKLRAAAKVEILLPTATVAATPAAAVSTEPAK